ncbi:MAG: Ig-like domain-containing protein [Patescibacteria group bacterium]
MIKTGSTYYCLRSSRDFSNTGPPAGFSSNEYFSIYSASHASTSLRPVLVVDYYATPGIPDMTAGTDLGSSSTDNITSDTTPDFTISCISGLTVTLYDNTTSVGTGVCSSSTVTITSSTLSEATHASMNAKQGGSDASGNLSITIDVTADAAPGTPDMTTGTDLGSSSTDNITSDNTPDFTMSCVSGSTVTLYDNVTSKGSGACSGSTVTITSSALSEGAHATMNAKQVDTAGNTSDASGNLSITIDVTADAAPGTPDMTAGTDSGSSSADNITSDNTPDFTMSCVSGSTVTLYDNVTSKGSGACSGSTVTITSSALSEGAHATMNAKQVDTAGNTSDASGNLSITIDVTAPTTPGTPSTTTPNTDTTPTFRWGASTDTGGSGLDYYSVDWSQDSGFSSGVTSSTSSTASCSLSTTTCGGATGLSSGTWYVRVKAFDLAGNSSSFSSNGSGEIITTTLNFQGVDMKGIDIR